MGSIARRLPMQVDLAMPANLTDPVIQDDVFSVSHDSLEGRSRWDTRPVNQIQPIPFFENTLPGWAGAATQNNLGLQGTPPGSGSLLCPAPGNNGVLPTNPTATQNIYELWNCFPHNETFSLFQMDLPASITGLSPALPNSKNGPYSFFHDQFASLYAWRNIGTSDYNALQVTYNGSLGSEPAGAV